MFIDRSLISGVIRTLNFNITEAQIEEWEDGANNKVQDLVKINDEGDEYFSD